MDLTESRPTPPAPRAKDSHKGDFGAVGILGGAPGMAGAAVLAGRAALRCGAGRVYLGLIDERIGVDPLAPELMLAGPRRVLELPAPACLVAGPGMGQSALARQWLELALRVKHALLLDADALNLIAAEPALKHQLRARPAPSLITPHPGEAARLMGVNTAAIQADRAGAARQLARDHGAIVVLKGADSLICGADGPIRRNPTGNPGMAAPGMGDALVGIVAALIAQGLAPIDAAVTGAWVHGAAGDRAVAAGLGPAGLTSSEVIQAARAVLNALSARTAAP